MYIWYQAISLICLDRDTLITTRACWELPLMCMNTVVIQYLAICTKMQWWSVVRPNMRVCWLYISYYYKLLFSYSSNISAENKRLSTMLENVLVMLECCQSVSSLKSCQKYYFGVANLCISGQILTWSFFWRNMHIQKKRR